MLSRLAVSAAALCATLAGPMAQAQDAPFVADDPEAFNLFLARLGVCANYVLQRDPAVFEAQSPEMLGGEQLDFTLGESVDEEFGVAFGRTDADGLEVRTMAFLAEDLGYSRTKAICVLETRDLSHDDALALANSAMQGLAGQFPVIRDFEIREISRIGWIGFCTPSDRPLQLEVHYDDDGEVEGLVIADAVHNRIYSCRYENHAEG